jgi:PAS domain-containing protein
VTSQAVEVILLKQLAGYLAMPVWLMDENGNLLFYNEAAEPLVGRAFADSGPITANELADLFVTTSEDGEPIPNDQLSTVIALTERQPSHSRLRFQAFDGASHLIDLTALPITGQGDRHLGVVVFFWEVQP